MNRLLLLLALIFAIVSCGGDEENNPPAKTTFGWPDGAVLSGEDPSACGIQLSWPEASLATGYRIYHGNKLLTSTSEKEYFVRALPLGTEATLSVEAYSEKGDVTERISLTEIIPDSVSEFSPPEPKAGLPGQFYDRVSFMFTGDEPYQCDVLENAITVKGVSVVKGKISDRDGKPLQNVAVSVTKKSEYGFSYSRADGWFDLAVNGGEELTIHYTKEGYLPVQRKITPGKNRYNFLEEIVMIPLDENKTVINFKDSLEVQIAQGSEMTDKDGTRQATMLFPKGTTVELVYKDGRKVPADQLTLRATEYTVGEKGPETMPATLPELSGYTYAVELSADEAIEGGAKTVQFNQAIYSYVDNFLNIPVGAIMPNGYYDYDQQKWIAAENGYVIKILSISDGIAAVDIDGDDIADEGEKLQKRDFTEEELRKLAEIYEAGKTLWRMPIKHLTPWDFNLPYKCDGACEVPEMGSDICEEPKKNAKSNRKTIVLPGGLTFTYSSSSADQGTDYLIEIELIKGDVPEKLQRVDLKVNIAGDLYQKTFAPAANLKHKFKMEGNRYRPELAIIKVGHVYKGIKLEAGEENFSFGEQGGDIEFGPSREEFTFWATKEEMVGIDHRDNDKNNGWDFDQQTRFDPASETVNYGGGLILPAETIKSSYWHTKKILGDGFADQSQASTLEQIAFWGTGDFFVLPDREFILDNSSDKLLFGKLGEVFQKYDRLPANDEIGRDQWGNLYFLTKGDDYSAECGRIYKMDQLKRTTLFAGGTIKQPFQENMSVSSACIPVFSDFAVTSNGVIYYTDNEHIRKIENEKITTYYSNDENGIFGTPKWIKIVQIDPKDPYRIYFYLDDSSIKSIDIIGNVTTIIGNGEAHSSTEYNGSVIMHGAFKLDELVLPDILDFEVYDGKLYFNDQCGRLIQIEDGVATSIAGCPNIVDRCDDAVLDFCKSSQKFLKAQTLHVYSDSEIYLLSPGNHQTQSAMYKIAKDETETEEGYFMLSQNGGGILYFDKDGKHLKTYDAVHGNPVISFDYNDQDLVTKVTDASGNTVDFQRDNQGNLEVVSDQFGNQVSFEHENGWMSKVHYPGGISIGFKYDTYGKMTTMTNPKGIDTTFHYDPDGYLTKTSDVMGGYVKQTNVAANHERVETAEKGKIDYLTTFDDDKQRVSETKWGSCNSKTIQKLDGSVKIVKPTGMEGLIVEGKDPRFKTINYVKEASTTFPSGRTLKLNTERKYKENKENFLKLDSYTVVNKINDRREITRHYDAINRVLTVRSPMGKEGKSHYDELGRIIKQEMPGFYATYYFYDDYGRLQKIVRGEGDETRSTEYEYNDLGQLFAIEDHTGKRVEYTYDEAGRVIETKLPDGYIVNQNFDENSNVTDITPVYEHGFNYTPVDMLETYTEPSVDGKTFETKYEYDLDRAVTKVTRPDKSEITYHYEAGTRRLKTISTDDGDVVYNYEDETGRLASVVKGSESVSYGYDGALVLSETITGAVSGKIEWDYDDDLRVSQLTVNNQGVDFSFDDDDQLIQAGDVSFSYDEVTGQLLNITQGDFVETPTYTNFGELESYSVTQNGNVVYKEQFTYDTTGRIETKTVTNNGSDTTEQYQYDLIGRLEKVFVDGVESVSYTFDDNGNRLTETKSGNTISGVYDAQDRLKTYGDLTFTYTDNGDVKTKEHSGGTDQYSYDALGTLKSVTLSNGDLIEYVTNARNRRVAKKRNGVVVQRMIYKDQLNPVAILDGENNITTLFVYGSRGNLPDYMIREGEKYKFIADYKGSVVKVIKMSDGSINQEISYDVWGNVLSDSNPGFQPFYYVGGLYDVDTKLLKFGVRSYDPEVGRWLQKEPLGFKGALNFYSYCEGEPVNWVDLDGKKIKIVGSDKFKKRILRFIKDSRAENSCLSKIIKSLEESNFNHVIEEIEISEANRDNSNYLRKRLTNDVKNIAFTNGDTLTRIIGFDFDIIINNKGYFYTPESQTAHELTHAFQFENKITCSYSKCDEDQALGVQASVGDYPKIRSESDITNGYFEIIDILLGTE